MTGMKFVPSVIKEEVEEEEDLSQLVSPLHGG